jgi:hypothetical protein
MASSPVVRRGTSSQRELRKANKKCSVEGCENIRAKDGARGLCGKCYRTSRQAEKDVPNHSRALSVLEDADVLLPARPRFEWLGNLQESVRALREE